MNRIYCAVGKITELTQQIEMKLNDVCENSEIIKEFGRHEKMTRQDLSQVESDAKYLKDKMENMTLGARISIIYESKSLNKEEINELRAHLEKRNYLAHEYFKYTKFENMSEEELAEEFEALKEHIRKLKEMLTRLNLIFDGQIKRLEYLKNQIK